jgi:dipeptide/tripeptide permease
MHSIRIICMHVFAIICFHVFCVAWFQGNESFEKLASMGLIANLTVYLQTRYNMDGIQLVNVYNIWSGSTNVTPLLGAFLSDAYLGRFRTLLFGSMSSFLVKSSVCTFPMTRVDCDIINKHVL